MNRKIPTLAAFVILLICSAIFLMIFINSYYSYKESAALVTQEKSGKSAACEPKAYAGEASIKGWYANSGQKKVVRVAKEDLSKLPVSKVEIKIIDISPDVDKKLKKSTEKEPQEITITGFADFCDGEALASINYKDGIFRPYLEN